MISHRHKAIFVHIPKTGGSSIMSVLWPDPQPSDLYMGFIDEYHNKYTTDGLQHLPARYIRTEVGEKIFSRYLKFSMVRNPYTKVLSQYSYMRIRPDLRTFIGMDESDSLETYLTLIQKQEHVHWAPQVTFLFDLSGELLVDRIMRFENYNNEVAGLFKELKIKVRQIPHVNKSPQDLGSEILSPRAIQQINRIYRDDFQTFGYEVR